MPPKPAITKSTRISTPHDPWTALFPAEEPQRATRFLVETWVALTARAPRQFASNLSEPKLTEQFWIYLNNLSSPEGRLTGFWNYETHKLAFDLERGEMIKRIRTDIDYLSNAGGARIELTFEFKKLKATSNSWRAYQGVSGMRRFVDGYYARHAPVALMVAMTVDDTKACVDGLRRSLQNSGKRTDLCMLPDAAGRYIRDPSEIFAGSATFDTEHKRPEDQAPPQGATTLAHIFLPLPPKLR
ncbi:hypothetical protein KHF85_00900 [Xanthomonas translucens pv. graminis]|uniref:hypothetical protein n=1 Tax=Xanthomonas graminis TaxID=3390026 RepID=UPI0025418024|nr:hypothetical protein [Xanthomonas translucens]WIH05133.1 hypothetical protein KHF85_00900 [Xanthomonas translucens pv. graminis]